MALLQEVTDAMRARQLSAPEKWTMTFREWIQFVEHCIGLDEFKHAKRRNRCTESCTNLLFRSCNFVELWAHVLRLESEVE